MWGRLFNLRRVGNPPPAAEPGYSFGKAGYAISIGCPRGAFGHALGPDRAAQNLPGRTEGLVQNTPVASGKRLTGAAPSVRSGSCGSYSSVGKALARLKSTSDQQLGEIGDTVVRVAREHPPEGFRFWPIQTDVAEIWTERHIRPEQSLELLKEAVRVDKQAEIDNPSAARQYMQAVAQGLFNTFVLEIGLPTTLKTFAAAESAVEETKQYIDAHPEIPARLQRR